jgi:GNAT superfamily N-acetyltransferase
MIEGPRAARAEELPEVIRLSNHVFYPDSRILMERVLPALFSPGNAENLRVMVDDGKVVAMAGMVISDLCMDDVRLRAACIGSVCTLEEYRGKGLAAALMEDAIPHAAAHGASLALISGGRGLYRRMGCIDAGLFTVIDAARGSGRPDIPCRVRQWTVGDLEVLTALHASEPIRFIRTAEDMGALLGANAMFCRPSRTWIVQHQNRTVAYCCVSGPDDRTGAGVILAREIAGSRHAILASAPLLLEAEAADHLQIEVPAADTAMASLASTLGLPTRTIGMHGTLKVIDRPVFLGALAPRLRGAAPPVPDAPEDLAAAVFGSIERSAPPLADTLPLPLPGYGLNYI